GVHLTDEEAKRLKALAKKGVGVDKRAEALRKEIAARDEHIRALDGEINTLNQSVRSIARERDTWKANYERLWAEVREFIGAIRRIPERLRAFIAEHLPGTKKHERDEGAR
ncbi:MAG: hypothetical protein LBR76_04665, partial [Oscillospiraceae bacterium]|nr:hypothetical protein [Oscillospiraceae bacterium]